MADKQKLASISPLLLAWYQKEKRELPFRKNPNAYHIWISEIMLQQTRMETVLPYFERFIQELPSISDLAEANEDKLLKLWEGLGYYQRVRNMKKAAIEIVAKYEGKFPNKYEDIISLPGIGDYTAGAILSIAFNQRYPAVDGNVLRVISRILGSYEDISKQTTKNTFRSLLKENMPSEAGDFNQALMELGALVCLPNGMPKCELCPLSEYCESNQNDVIQEIPVNQKKKSRKIEEITVLLIKKGEKYLLEKKKSKGVLHNMFVFPYLDGKRTEKEIKKHLLAQAYVIKHLAFKGKEKHIFTHIEWKMDVYQIEVETLEEGSGWYTVKEINEDIMLPTAFKKLLSSVLE